MTNVIPFPKTNIVALVAKLEAFYRSIDNGIVPDHSMCADLEAELAVATANTEREASARKRIEDRWLGYAIEGDVSRFGMLVDMQMKRTARVG